MYRRKPGVKQLYNNTQTRRYKSAHIRWQLGQSLRVEGIEPDGNEMLVRFQSSRSPDGLWRVRVRLVGSGGAILNPNDLPYYEDPPGVPPQTGPNTLWARVVKYYVITSGLLSCPGGVAPAWPQPPGTTYTYGGVESITITSSAPFPRSSFLDPFDYPQQQGLLTADYFAGTAPDITYTVRTYGTSYALNELGNYPSDGSSGGGGGGGGGVIGTDPANYELVSCTCPDYAKLIAANPRSPWRSEQRSRSWATSRAGTAGLCKHMFATRKYFNMPTIEPKPDNPTDQKRWLAARAAEKWQRLKRRKAWAAERAADRAVLRNARARDKAEIKAIRDQLRTIRKRRAAVYDSNRKRREQAYAQAKQQFQARKARLLSALHPDAVATQQEIDIALERQAQYNRIEQDMRDRESDYNARAAKRKRGKNKFSKKRRR